MRRAYWLIATWLVAACGGASDSEIWSNVQQCTLHEDASVCSAPSQSITAAPYEGAATEVSAGVTYAISGPGPGMRGYVVFTPLKSGTHTLYVGNGEPIRVCDEAALCASAVTGCGEFHRAARYSFKKGLRNVIELPPTASNQPFLLHIVAPEMPPPPPGGPRLAAPMFYSTGGWSAEYIRVADLDGDGALDVVVAQCNDANGENWLDIMRGSGTGSFAPVNRVPTACPAEFAVSDFNSDGIADIAGVAWDGQGPLPNFYLTGTGNFMYTTSTWLRTIEFTGSLDAADFDEDGVLDLVAPFETTTPPFRNGFVVVKMPEFQVVHEEVGGLLALGDFNGDGHQDVLVPRSTEPRLRLLVGDGTGTVTYDPAQQLPVGVGGSNAFDLDGNAYTDFVSVSNGSARVTLSSSGGFVTQVLSPATGGVAAGDFDGDGRIDLVLGAYNEDALSFYRGTSSGFVLEGTIPGSFKTCGFRPCWMATGDVNNDGRDDLITNKYVIGQGVIAVYLGTP